MISERYETYLKKLVDKTNNNKIKWRPIKEYIYSFVYPQCEESGIAQYIQTISCKEFCDLNYDKSFFVKKDGYTIAILDFKSISGKNGSKKDCLEVVGGIYNSSVKHFPEYIEGGFTHIQEAVLRYWERKNGDYNLEMSDNFELLSIFTEED